MGEISQPKYSQDDHCVRSVFRSLCQRSLPRIPQKKNILRITVRLACLPPAIHSPSDTDNKDKHNGIILMSLFSKEQHWQCDGNVQLAAVLSPPPFPVPSLPNFSSDRCAVQAMSGCVLPSPLRLLLRDGFLVIFSSLSHPRTLGRQTPKMTLIVPCSCLPSV